MFFLVLLRLLLHIRVGVLLRLPLHGLFGVLLRLLLHVLVGVLLRLLLRARLSVFLMFFLVFSAECSCMFCLVLLILVFSSGLVQVPCSRVSYFSSMKHNSAMSQRMSASRPRGGAVGDTEDDNGAAWGAV